MWVPTLQVLLQGAALPTGLVFSAFMICITIGGRLFALAHGRLSDQTMALILSGFSAISMSVPFLSNSFTITLVAFFAFEVCDFHHLYYSYNYRRYVLVHTLHVLLLCEADTLVVIRWELR